MLLHDERVQLVEYCHRMQADDLTVGTSGNRIVLHLVNAMKRLGTRRGIATECIGGGLGG